MMDSVVKRYKNLARLKKIAAAENKLSLAHIDSLELLEIIKSELPNPTIYDVGANVGTWAKLALTIFPGAEIQCFEPLPDHSKKCTELFNNYPNVKVHTVALGAKNYTDNINVASLTDASSLLELSEDCKEKYNLSVSGKVEITVKNLDDFIADNNLNAPDVIKLDIQGFELEALKGASDILKKTKYVLTEVSFTEFYKGQAYFSDIVSYLNTYGFELCALSESTRTGKLLEQTDVLFKKR
jgi:FkbM family methyltransferase